MNRIILVGAAVIAVIGLTVVVWFVRDPADASVPATPAASAQQQFDTTGGQEMRPRWDTRKEQGNDAADN